MAFAVDDVEEGAVGFVGSAVFDGVDECFHFIVEILHAHRRDFPNQSSSTRG